MAGVVDDELDFEALDAQISQRIDRRSVMKPPPILAKPPPKPEPKRILVEWLEQKKDKSLDNTPSLHVPGAAAWYKRLWVLFSDKLQGFKRNDPTTARFTVLLWQVDKVVRHPDKKDGRRFDVLLADRRRFCFLTDTKAKADDWVYHLMVLRDEAIKERFEWYL